MAGLLTIRILHLHDGFGVAIISDNARLFRIALHEFKVRVPAPVRRFVRRAKTWFVCASAAEHVTAFSLEMQRAHGARIVHVNAPARAAHKAELPATPGAGQC